MILEAIRYQAVAQWPKKSQRTTSTKLDAAASACPVLLQANALGWLVYPPFDAIVTWRGGSTFDVQTDDELAVRIWQEVMREIHGCPSNWYCSKIPGVLQIDIGILFRTCPGCKLLITHPINRPEMAYWVQTGLLDSDWFWVPSTVNLQIQVQNCSFSLHRDQPICQIVPLEAERLDETELSQMELEAVPEAISLWRQYISDVYGKLGGVDPTGERIRRGVYHRYKSRAETSRTPTVCPFDDKAETE